MRTVRLGLEWFLNPDHTPLLIAKENGWFREAGIDLEVIEPEEHLDAVDAIEDGTMDLAITETAPPATPSSASPVFSTQTAASCTARTATSSGRVTWPGLASSIPAPPAQADRRSSAP
jgi:ABC-type nitrate/sulfonate/bicarbonate transport system substrate-binding protein